MTDGTAGSMGDDVLGDAYGQLHSAHQDLATTNDQLREALEELASMNEQLQGSNEHLHLLNRALQERCLRVDQVNAFLESVVVGLEAAVVVVDADLVVRVCNDAAQRLLGLDVRQVTGRPVLELDTGLPTTQLRAALQRALTGERQVVSVRVPGRLRPGTTLTCLVHVSPLRHEGGTFGALLFVQDQDCAPSP